eukprot:gb/GECG01008163.1/.p1 GENE.gb/GECG01008163.1/~~gb/GECG01008163.1/.p1  ORF type:complete len:584 (+),score=73.48 gb/GECG01008163.1/:1-1752(+)
MELEHVQGLCCLHSYFLSFWWLMLIVYGNELELLQTEWVSNFKHTMSATTNTTPSAIVPPKVRWGEDGPFPMDSEEANDVFYYAKVKYRGFEIPHASWEVPRRKLSELSQEQFFSEHVVPRKPVVLVPENPQEPLPGFLGAKKWTYDYLKQQAGDLDARVETRSSPEEGYGKGKSQQMKFREFVGELENGSTNFYMTTQPLPEDEDGPISLMTTPLDNLTQDFPSRPDILGNLIPYQYNVWIGRADKETTSSGLHHDFHDNLYVLLSGEKHFRLLSPSSAKKLDTSGPATCVLPNGVINHEFPTRLDGAHPLSVAQQRVEELTKTMPREATSGATGLPDSLDEIFQQAASSLYNANVHRVRGFVDIAEAHTDVFNFVLACNREGVEAVEGVKSLVEKGFGVKVAKSGALSGAKRNRSPHSDEDADDDTGGDGMEDLFRESEIDEDDEMEADLDRALDNYLEHGDNGEDDEDKDVEATPSKSATENELPSNFCRLVLTADDIQRGYKEGSFIGHCDVSAGEMLYLPAGWFHEVISSSSSDSSCTDVLPGSHMAFNYWIHPPATSDSASPYVDKYWWNRYCKLRS